MPPTGQWALKPAHRQCLEQIRYHNCVFILQHGETGDESDILSPWRMAVLRECLRVCLGPPLVDKLDTGEGYAIDHDDMGGAGLCWNSRLRGIIAVQSQSRAATLSTALSRDWPGQVANLGGHADILDLRGRLEKSAWGVESTNDSRLILIVSDICLQMLLTLGLIDMGELDLLFFDDLTGANHGHPYCQVMETFYAPLLAKRLLSLARGSDEEDQFGGRSLPRVGALATWQRTIPGEAPHAKVGRLTKLMQYNHKFHSVMIPLLLESMPNAIPVEEFSQLAQAPAPLSKIKLVFGNEDQVSRLAPDYDLVLRASKGGWSLDGGTSGAERRIQDLNAKRILLVGNDLASLETSLLIRLVRVADQIACLVSNPRSGAILLARLFGPALTKSDRPRDFLGAIDDLAMSAAHLVASNRSAFHLHCPQTGALVTPSLSVSLLLAICSYLPKPMVASDQGSESRSSAHVDIRTVSVKRVSTTGKVLDRSRSLFLTLIRLPCVLRDWLDKLEVRGPLTTNRTTSLTHAALEALKVLHASRLIDDHFLPTREVRTGSPKRPPSTNVDDRDEGRGEQEASLGEIKEVLPTELRLETLHQSGHKTLYLYVIHSEVLRRDEATHAADLREDELPLDTCIHLMDFNLFASGEDPSHSFGLLLGRPLGTEHDRGRAEGSLDVHADASIETALFETTIPCGAHLEIRVRLRRGGPVTLTEEQWKGLLEFQVFLFGALNPHSIIPGAEEPSIDARHEVPLDKRMGYLAAPVTFITDEHQSSSLASPTDMDPELYCKFILHGRRNLGDIVSSRGRNPSSPVTPQIDWVTIRAAIDQEAYEPLGELLEKMSSLKEASTVPAPHYPTSPGKPPVRVDFSLFTLRRLILYAPHKGIFYRAKCLRPDSSIISPFTSKQFPQVTNYADYMRIRYGLEAQATVTDDDGAYSGREHHGPQRWRHSMMVQVERIENLANLTRWISSGLHDEHGTPAVPIHRKTKDDPLMGNDDGNIETTTAGTSVVTGSVICCRFLKVVPLPYGLLRSAMLLLRALPDLEGQLLTMQFWRDQLYLLRPLWPPPRSMVEALTGLTAHTSYNYERLELLGDSILKLFTTIDLFMGQSASSSVGRLSKLRQERICNYNLYTLALSLQLPYYARLSPSQGRSSFSPPDIWSLLPRGSHTTAATRWPFANVLFDDGLLKWRRVQALSERRRRRHKLYHLFPDGQLVEVIEEQQWHESIRKQFRQLAATSSRSSCRGRQSPSLPDGATLPVITRYGIPVSAKSLADLVESAIAAFYHGPGGLRGALAFLVHTGLVAEHVQGWYQGCGLGEDDPNSYHGLVARPRHQVSDPLAERSLVRPSMRASVLGQVSGEELDFPYEHVEGILGYTFRDRRLLLQACTHASVDPTHNYERLKWLGDAILDWVITQHYYEMFPDPSWMTPDRISRARQTILCNEAFGELVVSLGLHPFLRVASGPLQLEIDRFVRAHRGGQVGPQGRSTQAQVTSKGRREALRDSSIIIPPPKALGDLWEALAGAIFLDLDLKMDDFASVFLPLLLPYLQRHADPHDLPSNPTSDFWHDVQVAGITSLVSLHYECHRRARGQVLVANDKTETIEDGTHGNVQAPSYGVGGISTVCQVFLGETLIGKGEGSNRATARAAALRQAVAHMRTQDRRHLCPR